MREIKFRAWDGERYLYLENADFEISYCGVQLYAEFGGSRIIECDLEQFTGMRDKNGKEIYEGDQCNVVTADGRVTHAHVVFIDGCFDLNFISPVVIGGKYHTSDYLKCSVVNHAIEVIGNIHENPELLK